MKKIIYLIVFILMAAAGVYYYTFVYAKNHHRNAQLESAVLIKAETLVKAYEENEQKANALYLNKALEVEGVVLSTSKDQANHTTLVIGNATSFSNVAVTLITSNPISQKIGDKVTVKGVCTGYLSDVVINEGVIQ